MGSGNAKINGPDYLLTADVVLVTFNYRLGALGKGHSYLEQSNDEPNDIKNGSALHASEKCDNLSVLIYEPFSPSRSHYSTWSLPFVLIFAVNSLRVFAFVYMEWYQTDMKSRYLQYVLQIRLFTVTVP